MTDMEKIKKTTEKQSSHKATEVNEEQKENNDLQEEIDNCKIEVAEWKDRFVHLNADFENFKRRMTEQQKLWIGTAQAEVLTELLEIVDNFERALTEHKKQEKTAAENKVWIEGFALIYQSLVGLLHKFGVEEITQHDAFNPIYHEALVQIDSPDHKTGAIVEVMQKGYRFKDKVLRPAKVSVAK